MNREPTVRLTQAPSGNLGGEGREVHRAAIGFVGRINGNLAAQF